MEDYDDKGFIYYERGSILLKGFFFKKHIKLKVTFTLNTINLMSYAAKIVDVIVTSECIHLYFLSIVT